MEQRKYISILGDDRSTFEGGHPQDRQFLLPQLCLLCGVCHPGGHLVDG